MVAALFLSVALVAAPVGVPWWGAGLAFPVLTLILGKFVMMANGRRQHLLTNQKEHLACPPSMGLAFSVRAMYTQTYTLLRRVAGPLRRKISS